MLREGFAKQLSNIISKHEININKFRDVCFTLVTADYMLGSNTKSLDIDLFTSFGSDKEWQEVLSVLGVEKKSITNSELPDVQKVRVICDALLIETKGSIEGTSLTSEVSSKVAYSLGVQKHAGTYDSIEECYKIFDLYDTKVITSELDWLTSLDNQLSNLDKVVRRFCKNKNLYDFIPDGKSFCKVPIKDLKYFDYSDVEDIDELIVYDNVIFSLENCLINSLRKSFSQSPVKGNIKLNEILSVLPNSMFGTQSANNYVPSLETRSDFPSFVRTKLETYLSTAKMYDINDLTNIIYSLCIVHGTRSGNFSLQEANKMLEEA